MRSKEEIFEEVMREYYTQFLAQALRICSNRNEAEDIVQNALLIAWKKFHFFHGQSRVATWIFRIVINESYALMRRKSHALESVCEDLECYPDECIHEN